jgi:hypothetical protein
MVFVPILSYYTCRLIGESLDQAQKVVLGYGNISSYPALAYHACGKKVLLLTHFLLALETTGVSIILFIMEISCGHGLLGNDGAPRWEILFACTFIVLFTSLVELPFYFRMGISSTLVVIIIIAAQVLELTTIPSISVDDSSK